MGVAGWSQGKMELVHPHRFYQHLTQVSLPTYIPLGAASPALVAASGPNYLDMPSQPGFPHNHV